VEVRGEIKTDHIIRKVFFVKNKPVTPGYRLQPGFPPLTCQSRTIMSANIQTIANSHLSAIQERVIASLATGLSFSAAAEAAGVHRNTVGNWRREIPSFAAAFEQAAREQARAFKEEALDAVPQATQTILAIMNDPAASPALRLRAAGMVLKMADLKSAALHNSAQSPSLSSAPPPLRVEALEAPCAPENSEIMHNSAQPHILPYRREYQKLGRNEPCPCKSGRKFKACCLNKAA
jgi:transposase-like protein